MGKSFKVDSDVVSILSPAYARERRARLPYLAVVDEAFQSSPQLTPGSDPFPRCGYSWRIHCFNPLPSLRQGATPANHDDALGRARVSILSPAYARERQRLNGAIRQGATVSILSPAYARERPEHQVVIAENAQVSILSPAYARERRNRTACRTRMTLFQSSPQLTPGSDRMRRIPRPSK